MPEDEVNRPIEGSEDETETLSEEVLEEARRRELEIPETMASPLEEEARREEERQAQEEERAQQEGQEGEQEDAQPTQEQLQQQAEQREDFFQEESANRELQGFLTFAEKHFPNKTREELVGIINQTQKEIWDRGISKKPEELVPLVKQFVPKMLIFDNDLNQERVGNFFDRLPQKHVSELSEHKTATIRWISDIQDVGAAQHNLAMLEKIVEKTEELNPENSFVLFGGDVLYDSHLEHMMIYDAAEVKQFHLDFVAPEIRKKIEEAEILSKEDWLNKGLLQQYTKQVNRIFSKIDPKLARAYLLGNNEAMPFLQEGESEKTGKDYFSQHMDFAHDIVDRGIDGVNVIGGVKVFSAEYWNTNRDQVITRKDTETGDFIRDPKTGEVIKKMNVYDSLNKEQPGLITVHGMPTFFYKGKHTWEDIEPEGLSLYLDEYNGKDPLYVLCGHTGKQGITRKKNSNGRDVILLNSNMNTRRDEHGVSARAITYDLNIDDGRISSVEAKTYEFQM